MVKEKFRKSLEKARLLEKKKIMSLKQLSEDDKQFRKRANILKKSIGPSRREKKRK